MPRIRTIKPEFFISDTVSALPLRARLTWIGLWTHCDDYGRCRANVKLIKAAVWPLDNVSLRDIEEDLEALIAQGLMLRYAADSKDYLQVAGWTEHQKVDRPSRSPIPGPNGALNGSSPHPRDTLASPREPLDREGKGREGKGREGAREATTYPQAVDSSGPEPSPRCAKHQHQRNPPRCGPCADARREHDAWQTERNRRVAAADKCPMHVGQLAHNCSICRSEMKGDRAAPAWNAPTTSFRAVAAVPTQPAEEPT